MNKILIIIILPLFLLNSCENDATILTSIKNGSELRDDSYLPFSLKQNYPNPFNGYTAINFSLSIPMKITIKLYTEDWVEAETIVGKDLMPGIYQVTFNASENGKPKIPTGDYFYVLEGNGICLVRKMRLIW